MFNARHVMIDYQINSLVFFLQTASAVAFILYHLSKNPDVQEKLYKEISSLLPEKNSPITYETLLNSHYLRAVFKESAR